MLVKAMTGFGRLSLVGFLALLIGCGGYYGNDQTVYPEENNRRAGGKNSYDVQNDTIFGEGGLTILGIGNEPPPSAGALGGGNGIGVNTYLWRASLDTVAFMPLASADPFGGVIITDWYSPSETPDERFKVNVYILARDLRSDGIRTSIFKQKLAEGTWVDAPVDAQTALRLEDAILSRARELRVAQRQ
ncbi:MAG: DUF3576 domain-containing protein [Rhodospirillales bacterium]